MAERGLLDAQAECRFGAVSARRLATLCPTCWGASRLGDVGGQMIYRATEEWVS
ncbi:MAG: hypothetical protein OXS50_07640 [Gammaproteobacteria bacterium]|nr:hypothetical protein [Gammaproteobacteria bacterium]